MKPAVARDVPPGGRDVVLIGTIGRSPLIDRLVASGKLDVRGIAGRWETSLEQVVADPMPGVRRAFVIDTGGLRDSYLGPPESRRAGFRSTPTLQGGTKP